MDIAKIYEQVSKETGASSQLVENIFKSYWLFLKDRIEKLPFERTLDEEEFKKLSTSFNIPSIGKLYCTFDDYKRTKERFKNIKELRHGRVCKEDDSGEGEPDRENQ